MLVLNGQDRISYIFVFAWQPKCHRMQDTASVNLHLRLFPAAMSLLSSNRLAPVFAKQGKDRHDHLKTNVAGGTPATTSHASMTMTVVGLPSRRHESRAFPIIVVLSFNFSLWRVAPSSTLFLFLPPLHTYANVPIPSFKTASVVIFVAGAKVSSG